MDRYSENKYKDLFVSCNNKVLTQENNLKLIDLINSRAFDHKGIVDAYGYSVSLSRDKRCIETTFKVEKVYVKYGFFSPRFDSLKYLPNLKVLSLTKCNGDLDISFFENLNDLETVSLMGCEQIIDFNPLLNIPNLKNVDVRNTKITDEIINKLENKKIKVKYGNTEDHYIKLSELFNTVRCWDYQNMESHNLSRFEMFELHDVSITRQGVSDLTPLKYLPKLRKLKLIFGNDDLDLSQLLHIHNLNELTLHYCSGITDFMPILKLDQLRELTIKGTEIPDEIINELRSKKVSIYCY